MSVPDDAADFVPPGRVLPLHQSGQNQLTASAGDGKLSSAVFSICRREMLRSMHEVDGHQAELILRALSAWAKAGAAAKPPVVLHQWAIYEVVDFVRGGGSGVPGAPYCPANTRRVCCT